MIRSILLIFTLVNIFGCATAPVAPVPEVSQGAGIYHRVAPGETLWRISQLYNTDLDEIVRTNHIPDAAVIEKGQLIFIPGATTQKTEIYNLATDSTFSWPAKGKTVSYYGAGENNGTNKGIDIAVRNAAEVYASAAGKITFCDNLKGYGKTIIVEHPNGIATVYTGDLQESVKLDDRVTEGSLIAKVASGPGKGVSLLHFEVRRGYRSQNPLYYLP